MMHFKGNVTDHILGHLEKIERNFSINTQKQ